MGTLELVIIVLILVFLLGGKKIPELVRGITQAKKEFKDASKEEK